ncbi:hypothetical protein [Sphingomonas sp. ID0503]|uniref:hypothetical protein n=1 Tax=Sphingomonas sp. ID0503 TaxID=3399691 RepID=UPI003AFAB31A
MPRTAASLKRPHGDVTEQCHPEIALVDASHMSIESPARALQERVASDLGAAGDAERVRWSPFARIGLVLWISALLWFGMLYGVAQRIA